MNVMASQVPNVTTAATAAGESLGALLANGVGNPAAQSRAARDAAYIQSLQHHNAVYDAQTEQIRQKAEGDRLANENTQLMRKRANDAAQAEGNAVVTRIGPAPAMVWQDYNQRKSQWDADIAAARARAAYSYGVGDGTPAQRADAANTMTGGDLVRYGDAADMRRGSALLGHNPGMNDYYGPGDPVVVDAPKIDAAKPHFFNNGADMNVRNPATGDWTQQHIAGAPVSDDQFLVDYIQRRNTGAPTKPEEDIRFKLLNEKQYPTTFREFTDENRIQHQVPISRAPYQFDNGPVPVTPPAAPTGMLTPPSVSPIIQQSAPPAVVGGAPPQASEPAAPPPSAPSQPAGQNPDAPPPPLLPPGTVTLGRGVVNPPTRDQGTAAKFATRAMNAEQVLSQIKTPQDAPSLIENIIRAPSDSERMNLVLAYASDPRYAEFFNAASQMITAIARDESGAAIGKQEYWRYAQEMLPAAVDSPQSLALKKSQRAAAIYGMLNEAYGKGSPEYNDMQQRMTASGIPPEAQFYHPDASGGGAPQIQPGEEKVIQHPRGAVRVKRL
jgi:hypothetical protein